MGPPAPAQRDAGVIAGPPLPMQAPACSLPAAPGAEPSPALPRAALQGQEQPLVLLPGEGRGPLQGLVHNEEWGTRPHGSGDTQRSPACPQPQQDPQPPARPFPPRCVIYRLCTGSQMVKENRAGGPASEGLPVPRGGETGRLLTACRDRRAANRYQCWCQCWHQRAWPPCHCPSRDKPWRAQGQPQGDPAAQEPP